MMKLKVHEPTVQSYQSKAQSCTSQKQMRTLSASWKRASAFNASAKMERRRAVDQLRTITAANNDEEKKISNTIAKAALVDRSVAIIEAKITAAKTSIQENSEQEVAMNNHWSSIGDEMKKMLNN
jgi:hypothetical protein